MIKGVGWGWNYIISSSTHSPIYPTKIYDKQPEQKLEQVGNPGIPLPAEKSFQKNFYLPRFINSIRVCVLIIFQTEFKAVH